MDGSPFFNRLQNALKEGIEMVQMNQTGVVTVPDPILTKKADPVEVFGMQTKVLAAQMRFLMDVKRGVGIAGPQVGRSQRIFLAYLHGMDRSPVTCINPVLSDLSEETEVDEEGCLSIPAVKCRVRRSVSCTLKAQNVKGEWFEMKLTGLAARIAQHENDHLDGVLITDIAEDN